MRSRRSNIRSLVIALLAVVLTGACDDSGLSRAVVELNPDAVSFTALEGGQSPAERHVAVTSSGYGTLAGLEATVAYGPAATGWLAATLAGPTAPSTLRLVVTTTPLAAGSYRATVSVESPAAGNGPQTVSVSLTVTPAPPAPPSDLTAVAVSPTQIDLAWADQSTNETSFVIESCGGAECTSFADVGTVIANVTAFQHIALSPATAHRYRLRAVNAAGTSAPSADASATTHAAAAIALAPTAVAFEAVSGGANPDGRGVNVTNGAGGVLAELAVGTVVYGVQQPTGWLDASLHGTTAPTTLGVVVTTGTLAPGTYTASAPVTSRLAGNSPQTVTVTLTVQPPLTPPTDLTAAAVSPSRINLVWMDNDPRSDEYDVERCEGAGCTNFARVAGIIGTSHSDNSLTPATSYSYRVRLHLPIGASLYSNVATAMSLGPPAIGLSATSAAFAAQAAGPDPAPQTVDVENSGDGALTGLAIGTISYGGGQPTNWLTATLSPSTPPATVTLRAATGTLLQGVYTAVVPITSPDALNSPQAITVTLTLTASLVPDLTITGPGGGPMSVTPTAVPAGGTATVSGFMIRNLGTAPSGSFDLGYYLSTDAVITVGDTRLLWSPVGSLAPGGSLSSSGLPILIPASTPAGDYHLGVLVDGPGAVIESNEGNNYASTALAVRTIPAAPSNLAANAISSSAISLTWTDQSSDETGFRIERCQIQLISCSTFSSVGQVGANITSFVSGGLAALSTYRHQVRALNGSVVSGPSNAVSATTQAAGTPPAPTDLAASAVSASQINLTWIDNANNEEVFRIERCAGATCTTFAEVATLGADIASYQNVGVGENATYRYRVRAQNAAGHSGYSAVAAATTPTASAPPAPPTGLGATAVSATQINLAWTDNSTTETGFRIERCYLGILPPGGVGVCGVFDEIAVVEAGVTAYQSGELTPTATYAHRVRAYNSVGTSGYSNPAYATAFPLPAAPTSLSATGLSDETIRLTWVDRSTDETGFEIEGCTGAPCTDAFRQVQTVGANSVSFAENRLSAGVTYSYRVRAVNANGSSPFSNIASATTQPLLPPSNLTATPSSGSQINLSWVDNATNEAGYRVERCTGTGCVSFSQIATLAHNATSYPSTFLAAGTSYSYRVFAFTQSNTSNTSNTVIATTLPLEQPSGLTATAMSSNQINLSWTYTGSGQQGFKIERCAGVGCTAFVQLATVSAMSYQSTGLAPTTSYSYRVRAYAATVNSPYSNTATATTP